MTTRRLFSKQLAIMLSCFFFVVAIGITTLTIFLFRAYYFSYYGFALIIAGYAVIMPVLSYFATKDRWAVIAYVSVLNIVGFMSFIYYVGFYTAFVFLWAIIVIPSYIYMGKRAGILSAGLLLIETVLALYVYRNELKNHGDFSFVIIFSLSSVIGANALGFIIARLIKNSQEHAEHLVESQQSEEFQLNRLDTLLNSISDTVLTLNRYGRITSQNSAALSFFDTNQSLVGKSIDSIIELCDASMQPFSIRQLATNIRTTVIRDDISFHDSSDSVMRLSVQVSPIYSKFGEDENGCVVIIRDITRQKTLEDEKDEFISVTSHELRTPIAIAEGSLSNLVFMFDKGAKPEQLVASATMAHEQILYLARMINDLSTLSRAERGVGDATEEININTMLQELYLRYQPEAEAKSLKLNLDLDSLPTAVTSRLYLEEILQNFLTNAIKYTKKGSVTLSGKVHNGKIECAVKDTGIGISKTDQEKVFDKFFRSEDYRTRETSGTGLGLYVVKKLADKLGTTISVSSRLNHGSTFSFILPLKSDKLGTGKRTSV